MPTAGGSISTCIRQGPAGGAAIRFRAALQEAAKMICITPSITIDEAEISQTFIRASGPGGQNVNKVATAVQLRFDAARSPSLPAGVRRRLLRLSGKRMTAEGVLVITARRFRTRERNRQDAVERLVSLVRRAAEPPRRRRRTAPPTASIQRRLELKRRRSKLKSTRGGVGRDDG